MERLDFIKKCGALCLGGAVISQLLQSCQATHTAVTEQVGNNLKVKKSEFVITKDGVSSFRSFVVLHDDKLKFPIYLNRINETEYSALWMECTHQGVELSANGDYLSCSAHGSEFDKFGKVTEGPANRPLRTFKTTSENDFILISLA